MGHLVDAVLTQTVIKINRAAHALDGVELVGSIVMRALEGQKINHYSRVFWDRNGTKTHGSQTQKEKKMRRLG